MSLLDSLAGAAVDKIMGGGAASLLPTLLEQLKNYPGGFGGLISSFQKGGLGEVIASWIGSGDNQPVSPSQLGSVLDSGWVSKLAGAAGQDNNGVLGMLSELLPQVVDKATPDGAVSHDQGFDAAGLLSSLSGLFGKNA